MVVEGESRHGPLGYVLDHLGPPPLVPGDYNASGSVDAAAVWRWTADNGLLRNTTFDTMQFGLEITATSGVQKRYSLNAYNTWWSGTSGTGPAI